MSGDVGVSILGPAALVVGGAVHPARPGAHARILSRLAIGGGREVRTALLLEAVWPGGPPRTATKSLQVHITTLRGWARERTDEGVVGTTAQGYCALVPIDVDDVAHLVADGQGSAAAGDLAAAEVALEQALAQWRGEGLDDLVDVADLEPERLRIQELRALATEAWFHVRLRRGGGAALVPDLERWLGRHPWRERPYQLLLEALAAVGRERDAAGVLDRARVALGEVGLVPGPLLRQASARLFGERPAPQPPLAGTTQIGRGAELDAARRALRAGESATVVVAGEAGIGKTRFAAAIAAEAAADGFEVTVVDCGRGGSIAEPGPDRAVVVDDLRWERHVDDVAALGRWHALVGPTLLVVEDLHAADRPTIERLLALASSPPEHLAVLITVRPGDGGRRPEVAAALGALEAAGATSIGLGPLRPGLAADVVRSAGATLDEDAVAGIVERAGGNPLLLVELARAPVIGSPALAGDSLRAAVDERLGGLDPTERAVVEALAVLGGAADSVLLARALGIGHPAVIHALHRCTGDGLVVAEGEQRRLAHRLVGEVVVTSLDPDTHLRRACGLAAELTRRAELGTEVDAEAWARVAVASLPVGDPTAATAACVAASFRARGRHDWAGAARWLAAATEAIALTDAAADTRLRLLLDTGRLEVHAGVRGTARRTLLRAAALARATGDVAGLAEAAVALAGAYARVSDDPLLLDLVEEALDGLGRAEEPLRVRLLSGLALARFTNLDPSGPVLAAEALATARRLGDPATLAVALHGFHQATADPDVDYLALATETIAVARDGHAYEPLVAGYLDRHKELLVAGERHGARRDLVAARELVTGGGTPTLRWMLATWDAVDAMIDGRFDDAVTLAAAARSILGDDHLDAVVVEVATRSAADCLLGRGASTIASSGAFVAAGGPTGASLRGSVALGHVLEGDEERAAAELDLLAAADYGGAPHSRFWVVGLTAAAEAAWRLRHRGHGAAIAARLAPYAAEHVVLRFNQGGALYFGPVEHALGLAEGAAGRSKAALAHLRRAERAAERFDAPWWATRSRGAADEFGTAT